MKAPAFTCGKPDAWPEDNQRRRLAQINQALTRLRKAGVIGSEPTAAPETTEEPTKGTETEERGNDMAEELNQSQAIRAAFDTLGFEAKKEDVISWLKEHHPNVKIDGKKVDWDEKGSTITVEKSKYKGKLAGKAKGKPQATSEKEPAKAAPVKQPASFPASNLADSSPNAGLTTVDLVRMAQTLVQQLGADEVHKLIDLERRDNP